MAALEVVRVESAAQLEQAIAIRRMVFIHEQGVSEALEFDGLEDQAEHLLALSGGRPVGTLRIRLLDGGRTAKIERVAVLAAARGGRIGRALMLAALERARLAGASEVRLHAQTVVRGFYARLGFTAIGPEFEEDGIRHIAMRLRLAPAGLSAAG